MIPPPVTVYSTDLTHAREALADYMKGDYISNMNMDEQCVYFNFRKVDTTPHLEQFVHDLALGIVFTYNERTYTIHTQYF
jgi:hypothetical protein